MSDTTAHLNSEANFILSGHAPDAAQRETSFDALDLHVLAQTVMQGTREKHRFSAVPELLFEQAQRIEVWHLPQEDAALNVSTRVAENGSTLGRSENHLLVFAQDTRTQDVVDGCEIVAYPCDTNGRVSSWAHRYTAQALNFGMAGQKLRFKIINGLAELHLIENA
jgi:hypothetical protein